MNLLTLGLYSITFQFDYRTSHTTANLCISILQHIKIQNKSIYGKEFWVLYCWVLFLSVFKDILTMHYSSRTM